MSKKRLLIICLFLAGLLSNCSAIKSSTDDPTEASLTNPIPGTGTYTPTPGPTATQLANSTPTPARLPVQVENTPTATSLPESHYITDVPSFRQSYSISCEARSAVDWAAFFGTQIYESDFIAGLPSSDNPNKGFVGNVTDPWGQVPPYSYGVYAEPVADLLRDYGLPAKAASHFTLEELKHELATNQPVIAWVIGNMVGGIPAEYVAKDGDTVRVAAYEHTVTIIGYGEDRIRYKTNGKMFEIPTETFLNSWGVLENMVVFYDDQ
jgi:uncharacterized protein YvpB